MIYDAVFYILILLFILIIIGAYFYLIKKPTEKVSIKDLYAEGLDMLVSGKYKGAYKNFKEIVEKDSNNIKAYIRLGQVLRQSENYLKALKIHKSLLTRKNISNYELIEIHKNLSMDYLKIEDINLSINECKNILSIESDNEWALHQLIVFLNNIYLNIQSIYHMFYMVLSYYVKYYIS